jgi:hypothetical protein
VCLRQDLARDAEFVTIAAADVGGGRRAARRAEPSAPGHDAPLKI